MKTIDSRTADLAAVLRLAARGPVLLTSAGGEFVVSKADDFEVEVEALRQSPRFQAFLDRRLKSSTWIPLAKIEKEIAADLGKRQSRRKRREKG